MSKKKDQPADEEIIEEVAAEAAEDNAEDSVNPEEGSSKETSEASSAMSSLESELKNENDKYLRLLAEYDNFRKRNIKERKKYLHGRPRRHRLQVPPRLRQFVPGSAAGDD